MFKNFNLLILAGGRGPIIVLMNFLGYGAHIGHLTFKQSGLEKLWVVGAYFVAYDYFDGILILSNYLVISLKDFLSVMRFQF